MQVEDEIEEELFSNGLLRMVRDEIQKESYEEDSEEEENRRERKRCK